MKRVFIDVETTGTDHKTHGVHQISGMVEINGEIKEEFDFQTGLFPDDRVDADALEVSGVTRDQLNTYPSPGKVYSDITRILDGYIDKYNRLDKAVFVGYNAHFDMNFLREFFSKNGNPFFGSYFWFPPLDLMILAMNKLEDVRSEMSDFKLMTVAKQLGFMVDDSKLHDAKYDIELTRNLFLALKNETG